MTNDLVFIVNGVEVDAYNYFGVRMHTGFVNALFAPRTAKQLVSNTSRMQHGKRFLIPMRDNKADRKYEARDVTLNFTIDENGKSYSQNRDAFFKYLEESDVVRIKIPSRSSETFKLTYISSASFAENYWGTFGSVAVKFVEQNPNDRI